MAFGKNKAAFQRAVRVFRAAFAGSFEQTSTRTLDLLCYTLPSAAKQTTEHFAGIAGDIDVPRHEGDLVYKDLTWYEFEIESNPHAEALKFKREDWMSDRFGDHAQIARRYATRVRSAQRLRAIRKLVDGFTSDVGVYDGQFFFDSDHETADGRLYSNLQAGALSATTFDQAYAKLLGMPTIDGDSLFEQFDGELDVKLLVGPDNKATADDIVKATINGGDVNPRANRATVHVLHDLRAGGRFDAYKAYWWLMLANAPAQAGGDEHRPITRVEPEMPEVDIRLDPTDPRAWDYDEYDVKVRGNYGFGYRAPWVIVGSTGA